MKRKTSTVPSRIWKFGLPFGPAKEDAPRVENQILLAHRYRNELIAIERERRERYRAARREIVPGIEAAEKLVEEADAALEAAYQGIRTHRQKVRGRTADPNLKPLKVALKLARDALKVERGRASDSDALKLAAKTIDEEALAKAKAARAACGVYWGTYLRTEEAHRQSCKEPTDPEFRRWSGSSGCIGVHFMNGISVEEAHRGTRIFHIEKPDARSRSVVHLRVGSEGRDPVWARFALLLHRPLPPDAIIKSAWAQRHQVGTRWRWELCLALESQTFERKVRVPTHACGIDVGWLRVESGLRVAMLAGSDGHTQEIVLPNALLERLEHSRSIRSIMDRNFDKARDTLAAALPTLHSTWLTENTQALEKWRSTERLTKLVWEWRNNRFDGDQEIFEVLDAWRKQNRHLFQWAASEYDRALGHRREIYRTTASEIAKRYSSIAVEKLDLRKFAKRKPDDAKETEAERAQRYARTVASLHELFAAFKLAASNNGSTYTEGSPEYTTMDCHVCGYRCDFDAEHERSHVCEGCGAEWDQDLNAARNLLALGRAEAAE